MKVTCKTYSLMRLCIVLLLKESIFNIRIYLMKNHYKVNRFSGLSNGTYHLIILAYCLDLLSCNLLYIINAIFEIGIIIIEY